MTLNLQIITPIHNVMTCSTAVQIFVNKTKAICFDFDFNQFDDPEQ